MTIDTPAWARDAVFYQIFPDRFARSERVPKPGPLEPWDSPPTRHGFKGGDLLGIAEHLDDLADLGITALYLNPIFQSTANHRYHTYDYYAIDPLLGGDAALRELIDESHRRGIRVTLDGVFNHASRGFWPFSHVLENGAESPYRDWFHVDADRLRAGRGLRAYPTREDMEEMFEAAGGDHSGRFSLEHLGYRAWWDHPALPKLNVSNPECRAYLFGAIEHWTRFGIDGWRLDVPEEIEDGEFWPEFRRRVRAIDPESYIVGEIWHAAHDYLRGDRFDAVMNYPLLEALLGFAAGAHLDMREVEAQWELGENVRPLDGAALGRRIAEILDTYAPAITEVQLNLLDSHDTPRFLTMAGDDVASLRIAILLQMTLPGAPCLYYGDEIGIAGHHDPDCRRSYPWDRSTWNLPLRAFVKGAIGLRHAHAALRAGGTYRTVGAAGLAHAHVRADDRDLLVVCVNAAEEPCRVMLDLPEARGRTLSALTWDGFAAGAGVHAEVGADGAAEVGVPPRDGLVLRATA